MKKTFKIIFLAIILIIIGLSITYYLQVGRYIVSCQAFNKEHFEWLPYHRNDTLIFKSTDNKTRKYIVKKFKAYSTDYYNSRQKCGCCEERIEAILVYKNESIKINLENYNNKENCLGSFLRVNGEEFDEKGIKLKNGHINEIIVVKDNYKFYRKKGLIEFSLNNKKWKLVKRLDSNLETYIKDYSCVE